MRLASGYAKSQQSKTISQEDRAIESGLAHHLQTLIRTQSRSIIVVFLMYTLTTYLHIGNLLKAARRGLDISSQVAHGYRRNHSY